MQFHIYLQSWEEKQQIGENIRIIRSRLAGRLERRVGGEGRERLGEAGGSCSPQL